MRSPLCQNMINTIKLLDWTGLERILDETPNTSLYHAINELILTGTRLIDWLLYYPHGQALLMVLARLQSPQRALILTQPNILEENILSWYTLMWPSRLGAILELCDHQELIQLFNNSHQSVNRPHLDFARELAIGHVSLLIKQLLRFRAEQLEQILWHRVDQDETLITLILNAVENNSSMRKQENGDFFELISQIPHQRFITALNDAQFHGQFDRVYHLIYGKSDFFSQHRCLQLAQQSPPNQFEHTLARLMLTNAERDLIRKHRRRQEQQLLKFAKQEALRLCFGFGFGFGKTQLPIDVMVLIAAHGFRTKLPCIIHPEERTQLIQHKFFDYCLKLQNSFQKIKNPINLPSH